MTTSNILFARHARRQALQPLRRVNSRQMHAQNLRTVIVPHRLNDKLVKDSDKACQPSYEGQQLSCAAKPIDIADMIPSNDQFRRENEEGQRKRQADVRQLD